MDFNPFLDIDSPFRKGSGLQSFDDPITSHFAKDTDAPNLEPRWHAPQSPLSEVSSELWPNDSAPYRLPESWSQTIDSLLSQSAGHPSNPNFSPRDSSTQYTSTNSSGSIATPFQNNGESAWKPAATPNSPSDPFDILSSLKSDDVPTPAKLLFRSQQDIDSASPNGMVPLGSPPTGCIAPGDLTLPRVTHPLQLSTITNIPPASSPARSIPPIPPVPSSRLNQASTRGLSGWIPQSLDELRVPSPSPIAGLKPPCPRPSSAVLRQQPPYQLQNPVSISANTSVPFPPAIPQPPPRRTRGASRALMHPPPLFPHPALDAPDTGGNGYRHKDEDEEDEEEEEEDDDDGSDIYQPSSSPPQSSPRSREASPYSSSHRKIGLSGNHPYAASYRTIHTNSNPVALAGQIHRRGVAGTGSGNPVQTGTMERQIRRGKGKAKGSAALALAVVTQMSKLQQQQQHESTSSSDYPRGPMLPQRYDMNNAPDALPNGLLELSRLRASVRPGRKRKNSSIPLPVPVPHLIKKSRGRKVPYVPQPQAGELNASISSASSVFTTSGGIPSVMGSGGFQLGGEPEEPSHDAFSGGVALAAGSAATGGLMEDGGDDDSGVGPIRTGAGRAISMRGKKVVPGAPYSLAEGGKRAYMCEVPGCGKCFVRGEHLKRHVRSIHTYDKPHPCPYSGCDKTFSRRDNLGQHVRIHLQA